MNVIEYLRPLYELRKLAEVYNDELAAHMLVNEVGVLNEKMVNISFPYQILHVGYWISKFHRTMIHTWKE